MKACYCPKLKVHFGEDAKCEWCARADERHKLAKKIRGAVPIPLHAKTEAAKAAIEFVAEQFFRMATEIEKGD